MPNLRYTERLLALGKERKQLTSQLAALVASVANEIAYTVPVGTSVASGYAVVEIKSNLDSERFLAVEQDDEGYVVFDDHVEPGDSFYLHGDLGARVQVATRTEFLRLANKLPEVIAAFEADETATVAVLREAFERLKAMATA